MIDLERMADEIVAERKAKRKKRVGDVPRGAKSSRSKFALDAKAKFKKWRCRCSRLACQRRRTFPVHPDYMPKLPRCICGSYNWRIDWYRTSREESRRGTCTCGDFAPGSDGNPHPHRRGSTREFKGIKHVCKGKRHRF